MTRQKQGEGKDQAEGKGERNGKSGGEGKCKGQAKGEGMCVLLEEDKEEAEEGQELCNTDNWSTDKTNRTIQMVDVNAAANRHSQHARPRE